MKKIVIISLMFFVGAINAQQKGIQIGSLSLFPTLGFSYGYSDNVYLSNDESAENSYYTNFAPGIRLERIGDRTDFLLQYSFNKTFFESIDNNNFFDHNTSASFGYDVSHRNRFEISAEYTDGSDRRGTRNQQGNLLDLNLDPDEFHAYGVAGAWRFGGNGSKGQIDLSIGRQHRDYDNNRIYTATRDRQTYYFDGTYTHRVSPKTSLLVNTKIANIEYDFADLDNSEKRLMLGAEWDSKGKTSARALIGFLKKDFEFEGYDDFSGLALDLGVQYKIRSYSKLNLSASRETNETNGNGIYALSNTLDLGWTHDWRYRFSTNANIGYSSIDYEGSVRKDKLSYFGLSANYHFNKFFNSGLGFKRSKRTSSIDEFEYNDNSLLLTVEISK